MKLSSSLLLAVAVSLMCTVAQAHVSVSSGPVFAGATSELTFNIGHGCEGADTFRIEVRIPAGVTSVRPVDSVFGKAVVTKDAAGTVTSVTWTKAAADVLPADTQLYKLTVSAKLPNAPFTTLSFPTIQGCRAADGTELTHEWTGATATDPAPSVFLFPARTPGWNKYTVDQPIKDLTVFKDAQIVWAGTAAYSANPSTLGLIQQEANTQVLSDIQPGTEIWIRY
jgi:hypothetical protein